MDDTAKKEIADCMLEMFRKEREFVRLALHAGIYRPITPPWKFAPEIKKFFRKEYVEETDKKYEEDMINWTSLLEEYLKK